MLPLILAFLPEQFWGAGYALNRIRVKDQYTAVWFKVDGVQFSEIRSGVKI